MQTTVILCSTITIAYSHCQTTTGLVVVSSRPNVVSDGAFLTDDGKLCRTRAEATGKARSPSVESLMDGTTSMAESAERRRRRMSTLDDGHTTVLRLSFSVGG